ncbi:MAG: T9SS type A sorting domain-containing protein [Saprospiraceae bacterium]|nr:T9SS type A sorting domain-containing protein [Candidatus Vicinibacter affinis]
MSILFYLVSFFTVTVASVQPSPATCACSRMADSLVLVKLFESTNGANWSIKWNFNQGIENWYGINLDGMGCVRNISLSDNNLKGNLPPELGLLTNLKVLNLFNNQLTGTIPVSLGGLSLLEELNLENNQFTGSIPLSFSGLFSLKLASFSSNNLSGNFPLVLTDITTLNQLRLSDNFFTGTIPPGISKWNQINLIDFSNNQFSGNLPPNISLIRTLKELYLSNNNFSGELPGSMSLLTNLRNIWSNNNQSSGLVPDLTLAPLLSLRLEYNHFADIPDYSGLRTWGNSEPFGLVIHHNNFTFEDLIPLQKLPKNFYFDFKPQNPIPLDSIIFVPKAANFNIRLFTDPQILDNNYKWFKDTAVVFITNQNYYPLINMMEEDEGYYSGSVTNNAIAEFDIKISKTRVVFTLPGRCDNPPSGRFCEEAPHFCNTQDLHNYCGSFRSPDTSNQNKFICDSTGSLENPVWISFTAPTDSIVLEIFPMACEEINVNGEPFNGLQAAIYKACEVTGDRILYCESECRNGPFLIGGGGFVKGDRYLLLLDGCKGNFCNYLVKVVKGKANLNLSITGGVSGIRAFCPDTLEHLFSISPVFGATSYSWYLNDTLNQVTSDTVVRLKNLNSGIFKIAARATNECDTTDEIFTTFQIFPKLIVASKEIKKFFNDSVFQVNFTIQGGTKPYKVNKGSGVIDSISGKFVSDFILCNSSYQIEIIDRRGCITQISGFENCNCTSSAGNLPNDTMRLCESQNLIGKTLGNEKKDSGDAAIFILYTNFQNPVGSIVKTSKNGVFPFDPINFKFNTPYYLAHAISRTNSQGNINLLHPCLNLSNSQVIYFFPRPIVSAGGDRTFCGLAGNLNASGNFVKGNWRLVSGPGNVVIQNKDSSFSIVRVDTLGTYTFAFDGQSLYCPRTDEVKMQFLDSIKFSIMGAPFHCAGQITNLDAGIGFNSYSWSNGDTTRILKVTMPGNYCVTITDANGCAGVSCLEVVPSIAPEATLSAPDSLCTGVAGMIRVNENFSSYIWSTGSNNQVLQIDSGGIYCVTVTAENGCKDTSCVQVNALPRTLKVLSDSACYDTDYVFGSKPYKVPGKYEIIYPGAGKAGCDSIIRLNLSSYPLIEIQDSLIKHDKGTGNGSISVTLKGGVGAYRYLWNTGDRTSSINNLLSGTYVLTVRDEKNCVRIFRFTVRLETSSVDISSDNGLIVFPNPSGLGQEIYWQSNVPFSQAEIEVFKPDGSLIYTERFLQVQELTTYLLNNKFNSGIYLLRLKSTDGYRRIKKLVILNR